MTVFSCSSVGDLLPSFISCLESQDPRVVIAAVSSVKDLVLLCKGSGSFQPLYQQLQSSVYCMWLYSLSLHGFHSTFIIHCPQSIQPSLYTVPSPFNLHYTLSPEKDAQLLLSLLFQLSVQPSLSCTTELMKAVEACTSHTFR